MPPGILLEELHLSFLVSDRLPANDQDRIARSLRRRRFRSQLRGAIGAVLRRQPLLKKVRVSVSA
jgi:hypothetical protein